MAALVTTLAAHFAHVALPCMDRPRALLYYQNEIGNVRSGAVKRGCCAPGFGEQGSLTDHVASRDPTSLKAKGARRTRTRRQSRGDTTSQEVKSDAIVTREGRCDNGGSGGIGLAIARRFIAEGAFVFITGRRQAELDKAVSEIGTNLIAVRADVSRLGDIDRLYREVAAKKSKIHLLFANAGIYER